MNQNGSQPGFELPAPLPPQESGVAPFPERPVAQPERAPMPSQPVVSQPQPQPMIAPMPQPVAAVPVSAAASTSTTPAVADDNDLIEKEWVVKAKQIVAATREDPYTQNKELSKFKADYLKKRYNKDIKLEES